MNSLSLPDQVTAQRAPELDERFESLARTAVGEPGDPAVAFETVFDLDYGHADLEPAPVPTPTPAARRTAASPRALRLTRRGRLLLTLSFLGLALALMIPMGGWATATLTGGNPEPVQVVEVQAGDTLYDLAARVAAPGDVREMVYRIQELNSLPGAQISEGQRLAVPRG